MNYSLTATAIINEIPLNKQQFVLLVGKCNKTNADELQKYFEKSFNSYRFIWSVNPKFDGYEWSMMDAYGNLIFYSKGDNSN